MQKRFYSLRNDVQDIDSIFSNHYPEKDFNGKLALAAIELYLSTKQEKYLQDSYTYGEKAGADFWWSVGDINSLAHYKIAKYNPDFSKYIYQNLKHSLKIDGEFIFERRFSLFVGNHKCFSWN